MVKIYLKNLRGFNKPEIFVSLKRNKIAVVIWIKYNLVLVIRWIYRNILYDKMVKFQWHQSFKQVTYDSKVAIYTFLSGNKRHQDIKSEVCVSMKLEVLKLPGTSVTSNFKVLQKFSSTWFWDLSLTFILDLMRNEEGFKWISWEGSNKLENVC